MAIFMRNLFLLSVCFVLISCGGGGGEKSPEINNLTDKQDQDKSSQNKKEDNNGNTKLIPDAPVISLQNDDSNQLDWEYVTGYTSNTDYEYSIDTGATWQTVNTKPLVLNDENYAVGQIQLRVNASNKNQAGKIAKNTQAYTKQPVVGLPVPDAPSISKQDDVNDTLDWQYVAGYDQPTNYEYSLDSGVAWQSVSTKPLVLNDENYNIDQIQLRVKASNSNQAGKVAKNSQAYHVAPAKIATRYLDEEGNEVEHLEAAHCIQFSRQGKKLVTILANPEVEFGYQYRDYVGGTSKYLSKCGIKIKFLPPNKEEVTEFFDSSLKHALANKTDAGYWIDKPEEKIPADCQISRCNKVYHFALVKQSDGSFKEEKIERRESSKKHYRRYLIRHEQNWLTTFKNGDLAKTILPTPPTNLVVDDAKDTLAFGQSAGYTKDFDYEYSIDGGNNWIAVASNPILLANQTIAVNNIKLRVAETATNFASKAVSPNDGFSEDKSAAKKPKKYKLNNGKLIKKGKNDADYDCIKDGYLGVYWSRPSNDEVKWSTVAGRLQTANTSKVCGFNDWKLPSKDQFLSLKGTYEPYNKPIQNPLGRDIWADAPFDALKSSGAYYPSYPTDPSTTDGKVYYMSASSRAFDLSSNRKNSTHSEYYSVFTYAITMPRTYFAKIGGYQADIHKAQNKMQNWRNEAQKTRQTFDTKFKAIQTYQGAIDLNSELDTALKALATRINEWTIFETRMRKMSIELTRMDGLVSANKEGAFTTEDQTTWTAKFNQYKSMRDGLKQTLNPSTQDGLLEIEAKLKKLREQLNQIGGYKTQEAKISTALNTGKMDKNAITSAKGELEAANSALGSEPDADKAKALYDKATAMQQILHDSKANREALLSYQVEVTKLYNELNGKPSTPADMLAKIKTIKDQLDALLNDTNGTQGYSSLVNDQTSQAAIAVEKAFSQGLVITREQAKVTSGDVVFYKQDIKGRYIPSSSTYAQGYRCVEDGRFSQGERVWLLMQSGQPNSADMATYADLVKAGGLLEQAKTKTFCGKDNWIVPSMFQLKTLNTESVGTAKKSLYRIDNQVFVNHHGSDKNGSDLIYEGGFNSKRYYYWSNESPKTYKGLDNSKRKVYSYAIGDNKNGSAISEKDTTSVSIAHSEGNYVFARLLSDTPNSANSTYKMLDKTGKETSDKSKWVCSKDSASDLTWLRPTKLPQGNKKRGFDEAEKELESVHVCGSATWRLPKSAELKALAGKLERTPFFAELQVDDEHYATSEKEGFGYSTRYVSYWFSSKTKKAVLNSSNSVYQLWVTESTNVKAGNIPSWIDSSGNFVGLDRLGNESVSGVFYCIKDTAGKKIWTTPLLSKNDEEEKYTDDTGFFRTTDYCGIKGDQFKYPSITDLTTMISDKTSNLHKYINAYAGYTGRGYWSSKEEKVEPPSCNYSGTRCAKYHYAVDTNGNEIKAKYDEYDRPEDRSQKFYKRFYADTP